MAQTRRMGKRNRKGGPTRSAEVFALPYYVPFLAGLAFPLLMLTRVDGCRIGYRRTGLSRYQRGLDPLTLPSEIERFPPISQRDFLGHNFVYFDFPVIEIAEGAFERVNLRK
jgi:hypothetical protein